MAKKIAYFINQYPKVSHSFIRREILALEELGFSVARFALRGWDAELVDECDKKEQERTKYVLKRGAMGLLLPTLRLALSRPAAFWRGLRYALRLTRLRPYSLLRRLVIAGEAAQLFFWLRQAGAQHVHAHFGTNSTDVVAVSRAMGGPSFSFTVHGPDEYDRPVEYALGEKVATSSFAVTISSFGRSQLYRWTAVDHWPRIHIVHCGLGKDFLDAPTPPLPEGNSLVCVGRLCEQKGQLLLIEALSGIRDQLPADFRLILAGDGEMRSQIEESLAKHKLQDMVEITGWIDSKTVQSLLIRSRALILPSFAEGLPVVIMEAMASCRPALTTSIAGIPELVEHGSNGWLLTAGDQAALAQAILDLLQTPASETQKMGERAREEVRAKHSAELEAKKLAELILAA
ncbi:MAG: colanic acid biosynthesis glycosyltransferase WcaL [Planctomycetota bacterium]|nr:MAG: colanic acid biosynthesis glycosyltransferase WcaL [Planctomycetota bacterium]